MKKNAFTFVELMVVMAIGALIFAVTAVTFTQVTKSSRDARRKADLSSIAQALELCRSFQGTYPAPVGGAVPSPLTCSSQTYLNSVPQDPKTGAVYPYTRPTTTTYTLSATLENPVSTYVVTNP